MKNHVDTISRIAAALKEIPKRLIKNDSPDIEVVSGITLTSKGIIEAV